MKRVLFHVVVMILSVTFALGQNIENVTLTGSVTGVQAEKDGQGKYFYRIQLYFNLRNNTDQRIILFEPSNLHHLGGKFSVDLIGNVADATDNSISAGQLWVSPQTGTAIRSIPLLGDSVVDSLKRLESYDPNVPFFYTVFVEPGGYFEFRDWISLSNGFSPQPSTENPKESDAKPNFRSLKAKYFLKVTRSQFPDDLLISLQKKWSASGHLLLDSDGAFSLISEEIPMVVLK